MKFLNIIFILLLSNLIFGQNNQSIEKELENTIGDEGLIGAVWSIVNNDTISTGAVGLKNVISKEKLNRGDKVLVGSITKTLIATGVLRLVSQGRLVIDAPVNQYIQDIIFENSWKDTTPITLRHLLNHTSGIEDSKFWQVFSTQPSPNTPLKDIFSKNASILKVRTEPGTRYSYSNMGYSLLGLIIERITQKPYEIYLDNHLLKPLGMDSSTFQFVSQIGDNADKGLAMGHFENKVTQENVPMFLRPAGQFVTTAYDMALLANFLMGDGVIQQEQFIHKELLDQMGKPNSTESNKKGLFSGYQFGLSYRDRYKVVGYFHRGNTIGYRATFYLFPKQKKAFFISFNMDSEYADYELFNTIFINHLGVDKPKVVKTKEELAQNIDAFEGYYKINPVRFEKFAYLDLLFNSIQVEQKSNILEVKSLQSNTYTLFPISDYLFRKEDRIKPSHVLYENNNIQTISDGLLTYEKVSPIYLGLLLLNLIFGLLGILIILVRGFYLLIIKNLFKQNQIILLPFLSILGLFLPIPFLLNQSFLNLGELTFANLLLALSTGLLPLGLTLGITRNWKNNKSKIDVVGILLTFQWIIVLIYWELIPFKLWS